MPRRRKAKKPSTSRDEPTTGWKPQPDSSLLRLPGEIRNRIYEMVLNKLEEKENAQHCVLSFEAAPGLMNICRQVRAEFRPMVYDNVLRGLPPDVISVARQDLNKYLRIFCAKSAQPPNLTILLRTEDFRNSWKQNMRPFFLTLPEEYDGNDCKFDIDKQDIRGTGTMLWLPERMRGYLQKADGMPKEFRRDIKRNYISGLVLQFSSYSLTRSMVQTFWWITISNKTGVLEEYDQTKVHWYCCRLRPLSNVGDLRFEIHVQKRGGDQVDKWFWTKRHKFTRSPWGPK